MLARGKPKEVMNDLLRRALGLQPVTAMDLPAFDLGLRRGIDPVALNKLADDEDFRAG
jgi:hypothetical protein